MIAVNTIYNQDCLIGMSQISDKSVDMILCDLPYGTTNMEWDIVIDFDKLWGHYNRIIKDNGAIVLTGQQPFTTDLINSQRGLFRYEIIWEKTLALGFLNAKKMPMRSHENIVVFYKSLPTFNPQKTTVPNEKKRQKMASHEYKGYSGCSKITMYEYDGSRYPTSVLSMSNWNGALFGDTTTAVKHPTQKPVDLFRWLIATYTNEGDTVLDNCIGSGTTAIACIMEKRNYIGFETNKDYYEYAISRIVEFKSKPTLF